MPSINVIRTNHRVRRSNPLAGRREKQDQSHSQPLPVVAGKREGQAIGYGCPRCGGRHRVETDESVSVVWCPINGGKVVLAVEGVEPT